MNAEDSIFAGYHTIIVRPIKTVSSRYLAYLFDSDDWRIQIRTKVSGIKVFSITQSILKTTKVILPTLSEQKLIVDYLDNKLKTPQDVEEYLELPLLGVVIRENSNSLIHKR